MTYILKYYLLNILKALVPTFLCFKVIASSPNLNIRPVKQLENDIHSHLTIPFEGSEYEVIVIRQKDQSMMITSNCFNLIILTDNGTLSGHLDDVKAGDECGTSNLSTPTGRNIINLVLSIAKSLGVETLTLQDGSEKRCLDKNGNPSQEVINLDASGLLVEGITWYSKFGFTHEKDLNSAKANSISKIIASKTPGEIQKLIDKHAKPDSSIPLVSTITRDKSIREDRPIAFEIFRYIRDNHCEELAQFDTDIAGSFIAEIHDKKDYLFPFELVERYFHNMIIHPNQLPWNPSANKFDSVVKVLSEATNACVIN
ncbi:hypothetical protein OAB57_02910 [Bacteriovoracaceae bacterium]|nr:hypothetical protein [Bacteriovoracaceae bacterium]